MDTLLNALKAAAEPTRLRLLVLCAHGELSVSELTQILGQSQPRVSRHLKLLCDAGMLDRFREGIWAYFRLAETGAGGALARSLVDAIPDDDRTVALDLERLEQIRRARQDAAAQYFRDNAARWDEIRALHISDADVERAIVDLLPEDGVQDLLDIGTGTGRMLEVVGGRAARVLGIDASREMLAVARVNLERAGLRHCQVRLGDMYQLPLQSASQDVVLIHQVLHFAEEPADAVAEAARVLRPGGLLVVVDFARHDLEQLRSEHAHRRLGFDDAEIASWFLQAGLQAAPPRPMPGDPLTVTVWSARRAPQDLALSQSYLDAHALLPAKGTRQ